MTDTFSAVVTPDKAAYNQGDPIVLTLTGNDVVTTQVTEVASITGVITAADGATGPFGPVTVQLSKTTSATESIKLSAVTDSLGNAWTIDADGLHARAVFLKA